MNNDDAFEARRQHLLEALAQLDKAHQAARRPIADALAQIEGMRKPAPILWWHNCINVPPEELP